MIKGESKIMKALHDYLDLDTDGALKRKIDFFFTPYNNKVVANKYMQFEDRVHEQLH